MVLARVLLQNLRAVGFATSATRTSLCGSRRTAVALLLKDKPRLVGTPQQHHLVKRRVRGTGTVAAVAVVFAQSSCRARWCHWWEGRKRQALALVVGFHFVDGGAAAPELLFGVKAVELVRKQPRPRGAARFIHDVQPPPTTKAQGRG